VAAAWGSSAAASTSRPPAPRSSAGSRTGSPPWHRIASARGKTLFTGACPGIAYIKEANFVAGDLKERWPTGIRAFVNAAARERGVPTVVDLSTPVVEAGAYDSDRGTVLVLANFTYEPIAGLEVRLALPRKARSVRSAEKGPLAFAKAEPPAGTKLPAAVRFRLDLGIEDVVVVE
jgi:hypothetical protein